MRIHIPIKLPSLANTRSHWRYIANIKKKQREAVRLCIKDLVVPPLPLLVTITRIGPRHLDDDNLASACKYVRDEIAKKVGVDDGSDQYTWRYEQIKGLRYGVNVEVTMR
jgi:hypothetical protein